jgi:hypothetical protein
MAAASGGSQGLAYPDDDQQARDDEQHKYGIKHRVRAACMLRQNNGGGSR